MVVNPAGAAAQVHELCRIATGMTAGGPLAENAAAILARLEGPLRVAIAGRIKAGKSTLLNALVGERLAPTDAGECTQIVTWYVHGEAYDVQAKLSDGRSEALPFQRVDGALQIQLGTHSAADVASLEVSWPTSALAEVSLIDTPGLASLNDENSQRTRDFLEQGSESPSDADAVIYLMRHLHRADTECLGAFMDRSVSGASPVNAIAVLSRADEIGACRLDAMTSAARIAGRYQTNDTIRSLCTTVVPVAGLLAETGQTLREDEFGALRTLANDAPEALERLVRSVDDFCDISASNLTVELRSALLDRLGLFGVRFAIDAMTAGRASTSSELSRALVEASGLGGLRELISSQFLPRARILQARSAVVSLRALIAEVAPIDPAGAQQLAREIDTIEAGALEFAQLRTAHNVLSGMVELDEPERQEVERVMLAPSDAVALGSSPGDQAGQRTATLTGIEKWRARANDPMAQPVAVETAETMARTYETIFGRLTG